ncbi:hypothetical protein VCSRO96_2817 [Vibrio cholerae]|nr:hypothetical protein VCSRO96_2817 [Vibrio cholerae]GIA68569.1 hypothetical protein VCSRO4_3151 [Vibrio cholerae]
MISVKNGGGQNLKQISLFSRTATNFLRQQVSNITPENFSYLIGLFESDVHFSPFYSPNIAPINISRKRQFVLRNTFVFTHIANIDAKFFR